MKLVLQIAFGVFIGTLAALSIMDVVHSRREAKQTQTAQQQKAEELRLQQEEQAKVREIIQQRAEQQPVLEDDMDEPVLDDDEGIEAEVEGE